MELFNGKILKEFGLKCGGVRKEKMNFVCNTDKGVFCVQKTTAMPERIQFVHDVKRRLSENGFKDTDAFLETSDGLPYAEEEGETYVVFNYIPQTFKETSFADKGDTLATVKAAAKMHTALKRVGEGREISACGIPSIGAFADYDDVEDLFAKHMRTLKNCRKIAVGRPRMSDFDVMFLKNCDFFTESLKEWRELAGSDSYRNGVSRAGIRGDICHNLLKEETALRKPDGGVFVCNFQDADYRAFSFDLAAIVARHLKVVPYDTVPLEEIFETYCAVNALSKDEITLVLARLLLPEKFLNVCSKFYDKKRTWIPAATMGVMENVVSSKEIRKKYVDDYIKKM